MTERLDIAVMTGLKITLLSVLAMSFICLIVIVAIFCTELDTRQLQKETAALEKHTAELAVEEQKERVEYFKTLNKVYGTNYK